MYDVKKAVELDGRIDDFRRTYKLSKEDINDYASCPAEYMSCLPKKTLIGLYKEGVLCDHGYLSFTAFSGLVIVDYNEDYVFGYYFYSNDPKEYRYFRTKLRMTCPRGDDAESKYYFLYRGQRMFLDEFMRSSY